VAWIWKRQSEGKGRGQLQYEDNTQTGVEEIKVEGVDWFNVTEDMDSGTLL